MVRHRSTGLGQQAESGCSLRLHGCGERNADRVCRPKQLGEPDGRQVRSPHRLGNPNPVSALARRAAEGSKPRKAGGRRREWQLMATLNRRRKRSLLDARCRQLQDIRNGAVHVGWREPRFYFARSTHAGLPNSLFITEFPPCLFPRFAAY